MTMARQEKKQMFKDRLAWAMMMQGVDTDELFGKTEIPKFLLGKYLDGIHIPSAYNLKALARGLGVSVDWLLDCEIARDEDAVHGRTGAGVIVTAYDPMRDRQLRIAN